MYEPKAVPLVFRAVPVLLEEERICGYEVFLLNNPISVATNIRYGKSEFFVETGDIPDSYFNNTPRMTIAVDETDLLWDLVVNIEMHTDEGLNTSTFTGTPDGISCLMTIDEWNKFKTASRKCGDRLNEIMSSHRNKIRKWVKQKPEVFAV